MFFEAPFFLFLSLDGQIYAIIFQSHLAEENQLSFFLLHFDFFKIVFAARLVELVENFQNMSLVLALDKVL